MHFIYWVLHIEYNEIVLELELRDGGWLARTICIRSFDTISLGLRLGQIFDPSKAFLLLYLFFGWTTYVFRMVIFLHDTLSVELEFTDETHFLVDFAFATQNVLFLQWWLSSGSKVGPNHETDVSLIEWGSVAMFLLESSAFLFATGGLMNVHRHHIHYSRA